VIDGKLLDSKAEPMAYRETGAKDGASALFPDVFGDWMARLSRDQSWKRLRLAWRRSGLGALPRL